MTITEIIKTLEKHSPDETSELGEAIVSAIEILKRELSRDELTTKYIDLLYERLGKLAIEEIEYSDYDEMTDWLAEIRKEEKRLERRGTPLKPVYNHRYQELSCDYCGNQVSGWEETPNYCSNCGQAIDWSEE